MSLTFVRPEDTVSVPYPVPQEHQGDVVVPASEEIRVRKFIGQTGQKENGSSEGPQAFEVTFPPGGLTRAHFHSSDQFQVFFPAAGAWYQRHNIADVIVHYADAYTVYGPFGSRGPDALSFMTLRAHPSDLIAFMPGGRDKLPHRGGRNYERSVTVSDLSRQGPFARARSWLIEPEEDGLSALLLLCGPGEDVGEIGCDEPAAGRFYCVIGGSVSLDQSSFGSRSVGWIPDGALLGGLRAGAEGCALVFLQFPEAEPSSP